MTTSVISSVSHVPPVTANEIHALTRAANGEYTAASVEANPSAAAGLIKLKDGNYAEPIVAASDRYTGISADLSTLKLGG